MKRATLAALCAAMITATAALAHSGVKNPVVKARMDGMGAIADNTKILGGMAKGAIPFDAAKARAAAESIAAEARRIPELFAANETDPKTEARPEIWSNWADFAAKGIELEQIASEAKSVQTLDDVQAVLPSIGKTCKACHATYRLAN
ncbi:MAG: c-type cytochrome [Brevirhabdus sp.]